MATRIKSIIKGGDVFARLSDIILSLQEDLEHIKSNEVKEYVRDEIKILKDYENSIYKQAGM